MSVYWNSIASGNDLSHLRCQSTIWTNADVLSISPSGTNFSEIWIKIQNVSFMKMHLQCRLQMSAILSWGHELSWEYYTHIVTSGLGYPPVTEGLKQLLRASKVTLHDMDACSWILKDNFVCNQNKSRPRANETLFHVIPCWQTMEKLWWIRPVGGCGSLSAH